MANVKLANRCGVCNSNIWCGRPCGMAPGEKGVEEVPEPDLPTGPDDYLGWAVEASKEDRLALGRKLVEGVASIPPDQAPFHRAVGENEAPAPSRRAEVSTTYRYRDAEARRVYMREYMRKRRKG